MKVLVSRNCADNVCWLKKIEARDSPKISSTIRFRGYAIHPKFEAANSELNEMFLYLDPGYFRIFPEGLEESKQVNIRPPQSFNSLYYSLAIIGARLDHPISCGVHHLEFLCPHYVR